MTAIETVLADPATRTRDQGGTATADQVTAALSASSGPERGTTTAMVIPAG